MEKLMKYVEEMQKEGINICRPSFREHYLLEMVLVSKHYGLIKWLVENDKIDWDKVLRTGWEEEIGVFHRYDDYYCLLMLLSISDTPIDDLLLYLK